MADIIKDNVQTYVRELIQKEFESNKNEDKAFRTSENQIWVSIGISRSDPYEIV